MAKLSSTQILGNLIVDGEIINKATTSTEGVVQLNDAINSTSTTQAATANAVKKAYDLAATKAATSHTHNYAGSSSAGGAATSALTCTGNAATATKLATARTINGTAFDGSANITITAAANGGTSAACSGNAATATKLATARTINGTSFDGSANITITAAANGGTSAACSGNSATATKLATARTINGTSFDGSANITTANWGTARTLTVGKTGKSVNGSANVSWSLNEIGAMPGSTTSATTAATAQWYRIAQTTSSDQANTIGTFIIRASCSGKHSSTIINAGITYGQNPTLNQLAHTQYSGVGITQARVVYHTTYSGNKAYLEVYVPDAAARTIEVQLIGSMGWTLVAPNTVGSIPSGYTNTAITFSTNRIVANISGSVTGSAATLATARTINGTSFNGSANITTANWGTARTLTIGNTGKSVNGSANVTWSLDDIGVGSLSSLQTSTKTSIVAAINEVFQNVSNGKSSIAQAITSKGVSASASDTFASLSTKIKNIPTKKYDVGQTLTEGTNYNVPYGKTIKDDFCTMMGSDVQVIGVSRNHIAVCDNNKGETRFFKYSTTNGGYTQIGKTYDNYMNSIVDGYYTNSSSLNAPVYKMDTGATLYPPSLDEPSDITLQMYNQVYGQLIESVNDNGNIYYINISFGHTAPYVSNGLPYPPTPYVFYHIYRVTGTSFVTLAQGRVISSEEVDEYGSVVTDDRYFVVPLYGKYLIIDTSNNSTKVTSSSTRFSYDDRLLYADNGYLIGLNSNGRIETISLSTGVATYTSIYLPTGYEIPYENKNKPILYKYNSTNSLILPILSSGKVKSVILVQPTSSSSILFNITCVSEVSGYTKQIHGPTPRFTTFRFEPDYSKIVLK